MDHRVQMVISLMENNLRRELLLSEMSQYVALTPEHFCRIFKAEMGRTPANYLKWLRIQRAKELLMTTFLSVKQIMFIVGARDESHFRRDFKSVCGMTPMQYRIRHGVTNFTRDGVRNSIYQNPPANINIRH
jgi:transcriptional regulator GlxA family with amidase domain